MLEGDAVAIAIEGSARSGAVVGRVVGVGPDAAHLDGARVVAGPHQACGDCDVCRRAGATVCPAGQTLEPVDGRVIARARWVLPLGGELDVPGPRAALIAGEAAIAYAMYARAGVGPREPTAIHGDGPVARLLAQVLAVKSARVGGDHGARPAKVFGCEGGASAALAAAGPRSTVTIAVVPGLDLDADVLAAALAREVTVIAVRGAHPDLFPEIAALVVRGELDLS
jgi:threonine dehydrogenase-like Zn-dependent dehydrogenase